MPVWGCLSDNVPFLPSRIRKYLALVHSWLDNVAVGTIYKARGGDADGVLRCGRHHAVCDRTSITTPRLLLPGKAATELQRLFRLQLTGSCQKASHFISWETMKLSKNETVRAKSAQGEPESNATQSAANKVSVAQSQAKIGPDSRRHKTGNNRRQSLTLATCSILFSGLLNARRVSEYLSSCLKFCTHSDKNFPSHYCTLQLPSCKCLKIWIFNHNHYGQLIKKKTVGFLSVKCY